MSTVIQQSRFWHISDNKDFSSKRNWTVTLEADKFKVELKHALLMLFLQILLDQFVIKIPYMHRRL